MTIQRILKWTIFCVSVLTLASCSSDGSKLDNYHIGSADSQLQMLRVTGAALSPSFEITQRHYVSTADFSVTKISLQAWGKATDTIITINGQPLINQGEFALAVGNNRFKISVSNNKQITEQYQLTVVRLPEQNTNS